MVAVGGRSGRLNKHVCRAAGGRLQSVKARGRGEARRVGDRGKEVVGSVTRFDPLRRALCMPRLSPYAGQRRPNKVRRCVDLQPLTIKGWRQGAQDQSGIHPGLSDIRNPEGSSRQRQNQVLFR